MVSKFIVLFLFLVFNISFTFSQESDIEFFNIDSKAELRKNNEDKSYETSNYIIPYLGKGYKSLENNVMSNDVINFDRNDPNHIDSQTGINSKTFDLVYFNSTKEILQRYESKISISGDVKSTFKAKFKSNSKEIVKKGFDKVYFAFEGEFIDSRHSIDKSVKTPSKIVKDRLESGDLHYLYKAVGDSYVSEVEMGAGINILFECELKDKSKTSQFYTALKAKLTALKGSLRTKGSVKKFLSELNKEVSITGHIMKRGFSNTSDYAPNTIEYCLDLIDYFVNDNQYGSEIINFKIESLEATEGWPNSLNFSKYNYNLSLKEKYLNIVEECEYINSYYETIIDNKLYSEIQQENAKQLWIHNDTISTLLLKEINKINEYPFLAYDDIDVTINEKKFNLPDNDQENEFHSIFKKQIKIHMKDKVFFGSVPNDGKSYQFVLDGLLRWKRKKKVKYEFLFGAEDQWIEIELHTPKGIYRVNYSGSPIVVPPRTKIYLRGSRKNIRHGSLKAILYSID